MADDNGTGNGNSAEDSLKKLMGGLLDCLDQYSIGVGKAWIAYSSAVADFFGVETKVEKIEVVERK